METVPPGTPHLLNNGLSCDSAAYIFLILRYPELRPCPLEDLIVVSAQTGNESKKVKAQTEKHLYPRLKAAVMLPFPSPPDQRWGTFTLDRDMATRTYLFTQAESDQFKRLAALGFEREDYFGGTNEPQIRFLQLQEGVDFTFHLEPYVGDGGKEDCWQVEVHGKTSSGSNCIVCDQWLTLAEFDCLTSPQHWTTALTALRQKVRGSVALQAFLKTLAETTQNTPHSLLTE